MHRLLKSMDSSYKYCRKTSPKDILKLWKCLESIDFKISRKQFIQKLFSDNSTEFESETQLKTNINNALDDKLVAEEKDSKKGYRLKPLVDTKQWLNQRNDFYCFECHSCNSNEGLIECISCFRSFHRSCLKSDDESSVGSDQHLATHSTVKSSDNCCPMDANTSTKPESNQNCGQELNTDLLLDTESAEESVDAPIAPTIYTSLNRRKEDEEEEDYECLYCHRIKYPDNSSKVEIMCGQELSKLIVSFYRTIENHFKTKNIDIYNEYSIESTLNSYSLIFYPLDLKIIRMKVFEIKNYLSFGEFVNDLRHFCHNFCIVKDEDSIKTFIERIDNELNELEMCLHCYIWSKAPVDKRLPPQEWLIYVCDPPHRLVYAKYSSYPYWPTKVLKEDHCSALVWFFEPLSESGRFSYAEVSNDKMKPIDYKMDSKTLKSEKMVQSIALLFRYLKNLKAEEGYHFTYGDVMQYLEGVLTRQWIKHNYSFLSDLNLKPKTTADKKRKVETLKLKDCLDFDNYKRLHSECISSSTQISDISDSTQDSTVFSYDASASSEDMSTPFSQFLASDQFTAEDKMKTCSLYISLINNYQSKQLQQ